MPRNKDNWWDDIVGAESGVFTDDTFFCAFPESNAHYVDSEIYGKRIKLPSFNEEEWARLTREEFSYDSVEVMWDTASAKGVRWVGSETNRMEICYVDSSDWYFICKQGEKFFSVAIIGAHPEVHCNSFVFCNSDGSSGHDLDLEDFQNPRDTLEIMLGIANEFIQHQRH